MLEIEKTFFKIKFSELHFRQRVYEGDSIVTIHIMTDFYPSFAKDKIASGSVEIKIDALDIQKLDDLNGKKYQKDAGSVTISIQHDGIWEHEQVSDFTVSFQKRVGREICFLLESNICKIETPATMVSLYTTSTDQKKLSKYFDLKDFYDICVQRKIGERCISRYYIKD